MTRSPKTPTRSPAAKQVANPLLAPWRGKFGMPPFAKLKPEHFEPAFKRALKSHLAEIRGIGRNDANPTFRNTIEAMETCGRDLERVAEVFFNLASADTSPKLQEIERKIAPVLAAHQSAIYLDQHLFRRIDALHQRRDALKLDPEQLRLLDRTHTAFVRAGARLDPKARKRIAEINGRLAELVTTFSQNVLADEQSWRLSLDDESDLAGLPEGIRAAAARMASDLGVTARHVVTLQRSSIEPFLQFSSRRDLREDAFKAWIRRGEKGGRTDNRAIVKEIVTLRAELARLLGFRSFAAYSLEDTMAKTPLAVRDLLDRVWHPARKRAGMERDALAAIARSEGGNYKVEAWDWRYLAEKERKARFDLDESEIRPYLQLENMIDAAFETASRLFGLRFEEWPDAPRYHPDVRVWEVKDEKGQHVGVFMGDYFARPSKRSGAWMSSFRGQHKLGKGSRPIVVNVLNFARGADGEPTLLSLDDARTLFHEFGHGLHGLLSDVTYPSLAGTNVSRDFVELPSQLYEHWLTRPEILKAFARHAQTGKPMPERLVKRLHAARTFNQGFATVEYLASAVVDMDLHDLDQPAGLDIGKFEKDTLARLGMPSEIVMRHRIPHFQHIMGGYAAGYYSYLWSEVMDADAFAAFEEAGDIFDRDVARRLKEHIYSAGNRRDPLEAYVAFRGREPEVTSLLKKRGLAG
ncbi:MAG: M3 family metallopeptidase [Hyphomicrobium sp.]|nr:M3 family metallopeptidase [Hyphomicrobium sp.]